MHLEQVRDPVHRNQEQQEDRVQALVQVNPLDWERDIQPVIFKEEVVMEVLVVKQAVVWVNLEVQLRQLDQEITKEE